MLREIQAVRQDRPGLKRRWFQDEFFDLYTWHTRWGTLAGFQLCYDVRGRERALTWHRKSGFSHNRIDHGDDYAGQPATPHDMLSDREMEVLRLLGQGKTVSRIADDIALSAKTISTYRARLLEKLQLRTTADLVRYAVEHHLTA